MHTILAVIKLLQESEHVPYTFDVEQLTCTKRCDGKFSLLVCVLVLTSFS